MNGRQLLDDRSAFGFVADQFEQNDSTRGCGGATVDIMQAQTCFDVGAEFREYFLHNPGMFNSIRDVNANDNVFMYFHKSSLPYR